LAREDADRLGVNAIWIGFQNIQHALFHEFEDEIKLAFPSEGLLELHDVFMPHNSEDFHLPQGGLPDDFVFLRLFELLNGHHFIGVLVLAFQDYSIGTLAHHSKNVVFVHATP